MFPLALNSTRVSYQNSQVLKATATFSFDRYICGESSSLARALGLDLNNQAARDARASARQTERNNNTLSRIKVVFSNIYLVSFIFTDIENYFS